LVGLLLDQEEKVIMKNTIIGATIATATFLFSYTQDSSLIPVQGKEENLVIKEDYTKEELQEVYVDYLSTEGYKPVVNEAAGFIEFKYEGSTFILTVDETDTTYFALYVIFWSIDGPKEYNTALSVANSVNSSVKVSKVFLAKTAAIAAVEICLPKLKDYEVIFERSLKTLHQTANQFVKEISK
jgi:hypothetical protein